MRLRHGMMLTEHVYDDTVFDLSKLEDCRVRDKAVTTSCTHCPASLFKAAMSDGCFRQLVIDESEA